MLMAHDDNMNHVSEVFTQGFGYEIWTQTLAY